MKALVTGGTGFIGSNLVAHLLENKHDVYIMGTECEQEVPIIEQKRFATLEELEVSNEHFDVIFHQSANNDTTLLNRKQMVNDNVNFSKRLFNVAIANNCKRIVFASSTAVYGDAPVPYREDGPINPLNPYAKSKKQVEYLAMTLAKKHSDVVFVGLRYCNVYGPRENHKGKRASMIYQLAQQMLKGNPRIFKYGEQKRDYIYVKDVVAANMRAAEAKENCIVNCGLGKATSFNELIQLLNKVLGTNRTPEYIENPYTGRYQDYTECDTQLARKKLGFVPKYTLAQGIDDYYKSGYLTKP